MCCGSVYSCLCYTSRYSKKSTAHCDLCNEVFMNSTDTVWDFDGTKNFQLNIRKNSDTKIN